MRSQKIEKFWEERSRKFGTHLSGVLLKSVPEEINLYLDEWMFEQVKKVAGNRKKIKVLDIGCGYGRLSARLLEDFHSLSVLGVDLAKTYVDLYNQKLSPRGWAVKGDMRHLPFKDDVFDTVFMVTALMYLPSYKDQLQSLSEIERVLKPGGRFVIIERNPAGFNIFTLGGLVGKLRGKKHQEIPAVSFHPRALTALIAKTGMEVNKMEGMPLFTLIFPFLLIMTVINTGLGKLFLSAVKMIDQKLKRYIYPSLYISYSGVKGE